MASQEDSECESDAAGVPEDGCEEESHEVCSQQGNHAAINEEETPAPAPLTSKALEIAFQETPYLPPKASEPCGHEIELDETPCISPPTNPEHAETFITPSPKRTSIAKIAWAFKFLGVKLSTLYMLVVGLPRTDLR